MRALRPWQRTTATLITTGLIAGSAVVFTASAGTAAVSRAELTYVQNGNLYTANLDGSHPHRLVSGAVTGTAAWSVDGSQVAYIQNGDLFLARADGTQVRRVTSDGQASDPSTTIYSQFARVMYQDAGSYWMASEDPAQSPWWPQVTGTDASISSANLQTLYVDPNGNLSVLFQTVSPADVQARQPAFSPDGTEVAYVDPATGQITVRTLGPSADYSQLILGAPTLVTADASDDAHPQWSTDGKSLLYENGGNILTVSATAVAATGTVLVHNASGPTEVTFRPKHVIRESGSNATGTSIALSQRTFATVNSTTPDNRALANGVVLSSSVSAADALVGAQFAITRPLLLTKPNSLDPAVFAEIKRVLPPGGRVDLLGGANALSAAVEAKLKQAGYQTTRYAGNNMYDTAVKLDQTAFLNSVSFTAFVASSSDSDDVFATAPIASELAGVVVLAKGAAGNATVPAESLAYLNSMTPYDPNTGYGTKLVGVGAAGYQAITQALQNGQLSNWPADTPVTEIAGANSEETALQLARYNEPPKGKIALVRTSDWSDALLGAASVSENEGVVLYTGRSGLNAGVATFLGQNSPSIGEVDLLGGTSVLSNRVAADAKPLIASPNVVDYLCVMPGHVPPVLLNATARVNVVLPQNSRARAAAHIR